MRHLPQIVGTPQQLFGVKPRSQLDPQEDPYLTHIQTIKVLGIGPIES